MISVPCGTGDIADAMISASQMIYASRMKKRILYHIFTEWKYIIRLCGISYRTSDISLKKIRFYDIINSPINKNLYFGERLL